MTLPRHPRILIADDDDLLIALLKVRLSARGFSVLTASDGPSANQTAKAERPDVVVLDAMMPGFDGFEVARRLKEDSETCAIPIVMLTARRHIDDVKRARSLGVSAYVAKPFFPEQLVTRIRRLLGAIETSATS